MDFPDPPAFFKSYGLNAAGLHPCAASLAPPASPAQSYQCFGESWTVWEPRPSLKGTEHEELVSFDFPSGADGRDGAAHPSNYASEFKRLLCELVACYAGLLDVAAAAGATPEKVEVGLARFRTLAVNLAFVANSYRPHQAREELIAMTRAQIAQRKAATAKVRAALAVAKAEFEAAGQAATAAVDGVAVGATVGGVAVGAGESMEVEMEAGAAAPPTEAGAEESSSLADVLARVREELEAAPSLR